ncbi:MAG: D-tyrosyl-tRNA(Tyr) deacylase [Acidobacteria bacterium]|nr:D-tyrosyl-tRNA(Tyr) deacylase [Acidobacteriota bacterium]
MRALVQRVTRASVRADGSEIGSIGNGLCVLVGVTHDEDEATADKLADKIWNLRILDDEDGVMNLSIAQHGGEILVISQFTLYGSTRSGRRPSWVDAAAPAEAAPLVQRVIDTLRSLGAQVSTGKFGADMAVELVNDGPVTLLIEV